MKKTFKMGVLVLGAGLLLIGPVVFAATTLIPCGGSTQSACTWNDLYKLANNVIQFLINDVGIPLAVIVVVVSGIQLVLHPSDPTAKQVWKDRLQKGLIGLLIMLSAYLIVKVVVWGLTTGGDKYNLQSQVK